MHCMCIFVVKVSKECMRAHITINHISSVFLLHMYTSQKYTINVMLFDRTFWLTTFTYDQTFGVFVRILSDDRPLYLSL